MNLGLDRSKEREKKIQSEKRRRADASRKNDELLKIESFREFLAGIADDAMYLCMQSFDVEDWQRGYLDALRDVVNKVVTRSTLGPKWLGEYAAAKAEKLKVEG